MIAADDDSEARRLFTSLQQSFTNLFRGRRGQLPPPIDDIEAYWSPGEKAQASDMLQPLVRRLGRDGEAGLRRFVDETGADELIVAAAIHDHDARLTSYEILAEALRRTPR